MKHILNKYETWMKEKLYYLMKNHCFMNLHQTTRNIGSTFVGYYIICKHLLF